jgi:hypothetical protein
MGFGMTRTKSRIGASAVVFVGCGLLVMACDAGETSTIISSGGGAAVAGQSGVAGRAGVGGSSGNAGGPVTAGSAGTLSGGSGGAGGGGAGAGGSGGSAGAPNNCTKLPANLLLTDFSPTTFKGADGSTWKASKADLWGNANSLTGGDVFYQGTTASAPSVTLQGESLTITASVAAGDYAGYMFNFKPACTNASGTTGLRFDVLSDSTVGNATLKVQMQQKSDYPSTANPNSRPGDCVPSSVATQYTDCLSPGTTVVSSGTPIAPGTIELPWTTFAGGVPAPAIDSGQLMAIQWQFECPSDGGTIVSATGGSGSGGSGGMGVGGSSAGAATAGGDTGGLGAGGSSAGASGNPGVSGSGGSSAGSGGSAGSDAGTGGTAGTAGSSVTAGSGGTAGANTAGSSGSGSTTPPPCVVSIKIDNVTFY